MTDERLRLIAEMKDRLTPALRRLKTVMDSTGRTSTFQKLARDMSFAERAGYRLGFALGRSIRWGAIGAAASAGAAGAAFVKFGKDAADALDDTAALAKQIGISGDALRTLQGVAKRYNVTQEALGAGLTKFNLSFGRLKQNQGAFYNYLRKTNPALAAQFKQVGSTGDAFLLLSDAISKTADPAKRAALIKAAGLPQEFLRFFADGPDDLRETIKEVIKFQGLLGQGSYREAARYGDAMDNIGLAWIGLRDRMAATALPVVNPLLEDLAKFVANNREGIVSGFKEIATDVGAGLRVFGKWAGELKREDFQSVWKDIKETAVALASFAASINTVVQGFGGWKVVIGGILALKVAGKMKGLLGGVIPDGGVPGASSKSGGTAAQGMWTGLLLFDLMRNLPKSIDELAASMQAAKERSDAWNKSIESWLPRWMYNIDGWGAGGPSHPLGNRDPLREQYLRTQIDALDPQIRKMRAEYDQWIASGRDKTDPERFARFERNYRELLSRLKAFSDELSGRLKGDAPQIGKKIGASAADSFIQRLGLAFARFGGGGGGGGARVMQASYGGGGGGGRSFAGMGMLDLIAAAEGTGKNYNTTLGYGALTGGPVNLTGMTLDQIDALQTRMLGHPGNRWNSSAVGRYQIVRTTLRNLRKRFGLPGSMVFSPALQDALARALVAGRGNSVPGMRNEWEGLRKVPNRVLEDAMREHRRARQPRQTIEGSASVDIRFPNGVPAGTRVGASGKGLFKAVNLDTGRAMKPALA